MCPITFLKSGFIPSKVIPKESKKWSFSRNMDILCFQQAMTEPVKSGTSRQHVNVWELTWVTKNQFATFAFKTMDAVSWAQATTRASSSGTPNMVKSFIASPTNVCQPASNFTLLMVNRTSFWLVVTIRKSCNSIPTPRTSSNNMKSIWERSIQSHLLKMVNDSFQRLKIRKFICGNLEFQLSPNTYLSLGCTRFL